MRRHEMREMVPGWIDELFSLWALQMQHDDATTGYPRHSAGFGCQQSLKSWEDFEDAVDGWRASVAESIIDHMPVTQKIAISNVYCATVWTNARLDLNGVFAQAVENFGMLAKGRGLL